MSSSISISVIIPMFNISEYLSPCLESVLTQNLDNFEVIAVDDGSTDDSLKIAKEYQKKYSNLTVLHQDNKGAGAARNLGISKAKGKYIAFMDGDDLYPNAGILSKLVNIAETNDLKIVGGYHSKLRDGNSLPDDTDIIYQYIHKSKITDLKIVNYKDIQVDWNYQAYIYDAKFIKDLKLSFPDYLRGQDPPFFVSAMCNAEKFGLIPECTYVYRVSHKEVQWNNRKLFDLIKSHADLLKLTSKFNLNDLHEKVFQRLNVRYKPLFLDYLNSNGETELCAVLCYAVHYADFKVLSEKYKKNYVYSFMLENLAESFAMYLRNNQTSDRNYILNNFITLRNSYLKYESDETYIVHFIIKVINYLLDISTPYSIRLEINNLIKNNEFNIVKHLDNKLHCKYAEKIRSIESSIDFITKFNNRHRDLHDCVVSGCLKNATCKNIILSIIVPVYNVEDYLSECLDSIVETKLPKNSIEIICVNDGSTDKSMEILNRYSTKYYFISVITQDNGGLAAARNTGLKYASGKYVHFLDSDDCMQSGCYKLLIEKLEKYQLDMLFFNAHSFYENESLEAKYTWYKTGYQKNQEDSVISSGADYFCKCHTKGNLVVQACMYITKKSLIDNNHLRFPNGIIYEDNLFTITAMSKAQKVMHINDEFYLRRVREGSLSITKIKFGHAFGYFYTYQALLNYAQSTNLQDKLKNYLIQKSYMFRNMSADKYAQIDFESDKYYYLGFDNDLSLAFYNDVIKQSKLTDSLKKIKSQYECEHKQLTESNKAHKTLLEEHIKLEKQYNELKVKLDEIKNSHSGINLASNPSIIENLSDQLADIKKAIVKQITEQNNFTNLIKDLQQEVCNCIQKQSCAEIEYLDENVESLDNCVVTVPGSSKIFCCERSSYTKNIKDIPFKSSFRMESFCIRYLSRNDCCYKQVLMQKGQTFTRYFNKGAWTIWSRTE